MICPGKVKGVVECVTGLDKVQDKVRRGRGCGGGGAHMVECVTGLDKVQDKVRRGRGCGGGGEGRGGVFVWARQGTGQGEEGRRWGRRGEDQSRCRRGSGEGPARWCAWQGVEGGRGGMGGRRGHCGLCVAGIDEVQNTMRGGGGGPGSEHDGEGDLGVKGGGGERGPGSEHDGEGDLGVSVLINDYYYD